jgi:plastocyanin
MMRFLLTTACVFTALMTAPGPLRADGKKVAVAIDDLKFRPATVEVSVGDTVTWTNNDDREHTVTADDGSFDSGKLRTGKSFSRTFDKPGKYPYGSDPSPRTKGVVVVKGK